MLTVREDGRVLLHRRTDSGVWEIPEGASEPGDLVGSTAAVEATEAGWFALTELPESQLD